MKLYFATWIYEENQQESLNKKDGHNRLMSFYHLNDNETKGKATLEDYFNNENILRGQQRGMGSKGSDREE